MSELSLTIHVQSPAYAGEPTRFIARLAGDELARQDIVYTAWSFGDGLYAVGEIVDHVYASPGSYQVGAKALNTSRGHAADGELSVTVEPARTLEPAPEA